MVPRRWNETLSAQIVDLIGLRFLDQTDQPSLTLYTCTGTWKPLERDYDERLVAVARLRRFVPRI